MIDLFASLDCWQQQNEQIALATLVAVRGSAPRVPGARLALTRSGRMAGSVTGGCVENDVFERALKVLEGGQPALANYGLAEQSPLGVGLSCGSVDVLIEPYGPDSAWQSVRGAIEQHRPVVLAIALAPAPLLWRKLALGAGGESSGGIAPEIDGRIVAEAQRLLSRLDMARDKDAASSYLQSYRVFMVPALLMLDAQGKLLWSAQGEMNGEEITRQLSQLGG